MTLVNKIKSIYEERERRLIGAGFNAFIASFGLKPIDMLGSKLIGLSLYSADHMAVGTFIGSYFLGKDGYTIKGALKTLICIGISTIVWESVESELEISLGKLDTYHDIICNFVGAYGIGPLLNYFKKRAKS